MAIQDILEQTYPNLELIICDDASTDSTWSAIRQYSDHPKVRIFTQPKNLGVVDNKNFAIAKATGDFFTQQDHDDRSDPTRIERQVEALLLSGLSVCACGVRRIDQNGVEIARIAPPSDLIVRDFPGSGLPFFYPPTMFSRHTWERHGPFHNYFARSFGEDNFFVSSLLREYPIFVIADTLYDYVDTRKSITSLLGRRRNLVMEKVLERLRDQNMRLGTNDLEQGKVEALEAFEQEILGDRRYVAEQLRVYAARAIDHGRFSDGARLLAEAAVTFPMSGAMARTAAYWVRQRLRKKSD